MIAMAAVATAIAARLPALLSCAPLRRPQRDTTAGSRAMTLRTVALGPQLKTGEARSGTSSCYVQAARYRARANLFPAWPTATILPSAWMATVQALSARVVKSVVTFPSVSKLPSNVPSVS